ncbi:hypothetical protein DYI37_03170 [Fulvimarina endophytica]|uniref:Uncharacterized protein n=1 Tax=Fulvimarina endophytica TaxID=2293836 RepID=A0A371XB39_9HYPH|nr:hypothetical protein [Fulvimarina endophytica]RFC66458.1 hypothetical protein DYI37_03170 [Fulvimarina endophytica]
MADNAPTTRKIVKVVPGEGVYLDDGSILDGVTDVVLDPITPSAGITFTLKIGCRDQVTFEMPKPKTFGVGEFGREMVSTDVKTGRKMSSGLVDAISTMIMPRTPNQGGPVG